jgi:hypothetical protein
MENTMSDKPLKKLEKIRNKKIKQEAERLIKNDACEDIKSNLDWIETSSRLLSHQKNNKLFGFIPAPAVLIICFLVAGLLWAISIPEINVTMKTVSHSVGFTLSEKWSLPKPFTTGYLRIENFQALHAPELGISFDNESGSAEVEIYGENIVMEKLELERKGIIELDSSSNRLTFSIKQTKIKGAFSLEDISILETKGIKDVKIKGKKLEYPEYIEFSGTGESKVPTNIIFKINDFENEKGWKLENMKTHRMTFLKEDISADGYPSFISTIKEGEVKLYDVPVVEKIYKGDMVTMEHINLMRLDISGKDDIKIFMKGKVKGLKIGPKGFEKNLAPSFLEYFYHHQRFGFFWGAVAFLWGILWGLKETIFK